MRFWPRAWRAMSVAGLSLCCAGGCAAYLASQQPGKRNTAVLSPGTPRTHVIAELGAPIWSDEPDATRATDVFAFKQGYTRPVKAGRALAHGAADVFTAGLWEVVGIPTETLADGTDVKLEVTYGPERTVQSVTVLEGEKAVHPRPLFARRSKNGANKMSVVAREKKATITKPTAAPDEPIAVATDEGQNDGKTAKR